MLEEEWPDEDEVRAARMAVREEATPVPERAWALRNVASTLALGGPGERARARSLLEKAVLLKEQWLENDQHPGSANVGKINMMNFQGQKKAIHIEMTPHSPSKSWLQPQAVHKAVTVRTKPRHAGLL